MVTAFNLVYSASSVRRLLGISSSVAVRIQRFAFVIWVHVAGCRPTFISKILFRFHFAEWRKAQARGLTATQWVDQPRYFTVRNEAKGSTYHLDCHPDRIECRCHDYQNQIEILGRGCCKHGYAVLNKLGFSSLGAYVEAFKPGGYLSDPRYAKSA